jgi:hypothetical protein
MARCPRCRHEFYSRIELPVEPLFTLEVAAEIIPFTSAQSLATYLKRHHKDWQRYYRVIAHGRRRTLMRFVNAEQIKALRSEVVRSEWRSPKRRAASTSA